jgi:hypothetical protein
MRQGEAELWRGYAPSGAQTPGHSSSVSTTSHCGADEGGIEAPGEPGSRNATALRKLILAIRHKRTMTRRNIAMRTLLTIGATAGLFLALGGAAYAVPPNSPYATILPPDAVDGAAPAAPDDGAVYTDPYLVEGRSAYIDPDYDYGADVDADTYDWQYSAPVGGGIYFGGDAGRFHGGHFGHHWMRR